MNKPNKSYLLFTVVIMTGCYLPEEPIANVTSKTNTSATTTPNDTAIGTHPSKTQDGYLPIFDAEYPQHIVSNRMENNLKRMVEDPSNATGGHLFRSAGLLVNIPPGMEAAERFTGFEGKSDNGNRRATMVIITNPFSMKKTTSGLVSDAVRNQRIKIEFTKGLEIDNRTASFYLTVEPVGQGDNQINVAKYILAFGDEDFCWIVTCTFDREQEQEFGEALLRSILNVRISEEPRSPPGADLNFSLTPNRLKLTDGFVDKLVFTRSGVFKVDDEKEPVFQIQRSIIEFDISDKQAFARSLVSPGPLFKIDHVSAEKEVTIDDMTGYEFVSVGSDNQNGEPLWVYSLVLFDGGDCYVMHGWTSSDNEENYIDDFRALANSFKRKK